MLLRVAGGTRSVKPCSYPPPGPRMRRIKKTIMEEIASRIANCEGALSKATDDRRPAGLIQGLLFLTLRSLPLSCVQRGRYSLATLSDGPEADVLVQQGSSSQYFNETLLSRILEEVSCLAADGESSATRLADLGHRNEALNLC